MISLLAVAAFSFPKNLGRVNQDAILLPRLAGNGFLMAVADGLGSYSGSEFASSAAVTALAECWRGASSVANTLEEVRRVVADSDSDDRVYEGASTTLTYCHISDSGVAVGHIGDCRLYVLRDGGLRQVTRDHTQYQLLLDEGIYSSKDIPRKAKSVLYSAIGRGINMRSDEIYINGHDAYDDSGELVIYIMSDGAHKAWHHRPRLSRNTLSSPAKFAAALQDRISRLGASDDCSLVVAKFRRAVFFE